jgi:hypothetical protein
MCWLEEFVVIAVPFGWVVVEEALAGGCSGGFVDAT